MSLRYVVMILCLLMIFGGMTVAQTDEIQSELDALQALEFDAFLDESYYMMLRRNPEAVIQLSLQDELNLTDITLTDISEAYQQETAIIIRAILDQLQSRNRETLSAAQQISYDVYAWYLDDLLRLNEYRLYTYPISFFITADHNRTATFFTELHPLSTVQDAEDYITRLTLVDEKFAQIVANVQLRQDAGIIAPRGLLEWSLSDINRLSRGNPRNHEYFTAFVNGVASIPDLDTSEQNRLYSAAEAAIENHVMPAYQLLSDTVNTLLPDAPQAFGSWQYEDGDAYYADALRHHTSTFLSADEIHQLGLQELERIHAEMRDQFAALGYDPSDSIAQSYQRLIRLSTYVPQQRVVSTFETLIDEAYPRLDEAFSRIPEAEVVVIGGQSGGYYIPAALDGSRPGAFYATTSRAQSYYNMPSLLYHETIPGHHLQIAWAQERDLPAFQRGVLVTAYVEGWALYAERLASELGWYEGDAEGELGRLQYEAFRAARLVVDTGLHDRQWTFDEAVDFFVENTGFSRGMAQGQIARYAAWPGQATAYMIGLLEILRLRDLAQTMQGDTFDLIAFHDLLLNQGSVPLPILEQIVLNTIATN